MAKSIDILSIYGSRTCGGTTGRRIPRRKQALSIGIQYWIDQVADIAINPSISREKIQVNIARIKGVLELLVEPLNVSLSELSLKEP